MGQTRPSRDVRCTTALPPKADVHPRSCYVANVPKCMARPCGTRWTSKINERESCINVLRAIMGIRAHPRLARRKTLKGHLGTQSLGCAGQTVRPSLHSISQTSAGKLLMLNYSVSVLMIDVRGIT